MIRKLKIKLTALLLTFTIVFTTIPVVAMAKQTSAASEKPAYIVGEIESLRTETEKVFKQTGYSYEYVFVNDGSKDATKQKLKGLYPMTSWKGFADTISVK